MSKTRKGKTRKTESFPPTVGREFMFNNVRGEVLRTYERKHAGEIVVCRRTDLTYIRPEFELTLSEWNASAKPVPTPAPEREEMEDDGSTSDSPQSDDGSTSDSPQSDEEE